MAGATTGEFIEHVTPHAQRWDQIAATYYNDGSLTHVLVEANRDLFIDTLGPIPAILPPRTTIRVPVLEEAAVSDALLPPWRRST